MLSQCLDGTGNVIVMCVISLNGIRNLCFHSPLVCENFAFYLWSVISLDLNSQSILPAVCFCALHVYVITHMKKFHWLCMCDLQINANICEWTCMWSHKSHPCMFTSWTQLLVGQSSTTSCWTRVTLLCSSWIWQRKRWGKTWMISFVWYSGNFSSILSKNGFLFACMMTVCRCRILFQQRKSLIMLKYHANSAWNLAWTSPADKHSQCWSFQRWLKVIFFSFALLAYKQFY